MNMLSSTQVTQDINQNLDIKPKNLSYLLDVLGLIQNIDNNIETASKMEEHSNTKEYIQILFGALRQKERLILEIRYGLCGEQKLTLQTAGEQFGVSRERIRQIEHNAILKLTNKLSTMTHFTLVGKMKKSIQRHSGVISSKRLAEELQDELLDVGFDAGGLIELFQQLELFKDDTDKSRTRLKYIGDLNGWSLKKTYDQEQIILASNRIREILSEISHPMQWVELYSELHRSDGLLTLDEDLALNIALCLSDTERIYRDLSGNWTIQAEKDTVSRRVLATLRKIGSPAHFSEIAALYNELYPDRPLSEHNVHAKLGRNEFVRVGRGTYGLAEWGLHNDGNIPNAIRRILITHNRPMSVAEISEEVLRTWRVSYASIVVAANSDARFSKTKEGLIGLTELGLTVEKRRKYEGENHHDQVVNALLKINKPASAQEILDKLYQLYPDSPLTLVSIKNLLYRQDGPFVRLDMDIFGLSRWGMPSAIPQRFRKSSSRTQDLLAAMEKIGNPVHYKKLVRFYNQTHSERPISEEYVLQILIRLKKDKGCVIGYGQGIYGLKSWDKQDVLF
ncbi:MAG: sigma factor-like helix-turn-helix DNA-binding protein [Leptolinea sp.]